MTRFTDITPEILNRDHDLLKYLQQERYGIQRAKKGGTFVGGSKVLDRFREYGIVLPKGGMIFPGITPEKMTEVIQARERMETKNQAAAILEQFARINDVSLIHRIMRARPWHDAKILFFAPLTKEAQEKVIKSLMDDDGIPHEYKSYSVNSHNVQDLVNESVRSTSLEDVKKLTNRKIGHFFLAATLQFFPFEGASIQKIADAYDQEMHRREVADYKSLEAMIQDNPQNAVVWEMFQSIKTTALAMRGKRYPFSSQFAASRARRSLRKEFFVFENDVEAKIANLILAGEPLISREVDEDWTEGPKMFGRRRYIGGTEKRTRIFLGPFKVDNCPMSDHDGHHAEYNRLREAHERGVDIRPRGEIEFIDC